MQKYANLGGDSGVVQYEIGHDWIRVIFRDGGTYLYTYESTGEHNIEEMKKLAHEGMGLNSFINRFVRKNYQAKER